MEIKIVVDEQGNVHVGFKGPQTMFEAILPKMAAIEFGQTILKAANSTNLINPNPRERNVFGNPNLAPDNDDGMEIPK